MPPRTPKTESLAGPKKAPATEADFPVVAGTVALQAWMEMGTEAVRFVWDRLQQDIKTQQAMMACTSLDELRKVQAEFFAAAQAQYAAEAGRMMTLLGKATTVGLATPAKARRYDDVPL